MAHITVLADGFTEQGQRVRCVQTGDRIDDVIITVDEQQATLTARPSVRRDGGTRSYRTDLGMLVLPRRMSSDDRTPRWNGRALLAQPPA